MNRRNWRTLLIIIALIIDIISVGISGLLAYNVRSIIPNIPHLPESIFIQFSVFFGTALIIFLMFFGVYRAIFHINTTRQYFLAGKAYIYSVLVLLSLLYLFQNKYPRWFTLLFFLILPFIFVICRISLNKFIKYMQSRGYGVHNVILAGYDNGGIAIIERFKTFPELGYNIKGIITNQKKYSIHAKIHGTLVPRYHINELNSVISEYEIDRAFVPSTSVISNGYSDVLEICRKRNIKLKVLSEDSDRLLRLARVYDIAGVTLSAPKRQRINTMKRVIKRLFDICFAISALVIVSPILILTLLAIWIESGKPIIFKHHRAAIKGGKTFYFYKFRSMIKNADAMKESLLDQNESDGALFKIKDDPRMTRVGRIIRKFSIDELPQLFNVLKGDMSIVGPRPLPVNDFEKVKEPLEFWKWIKDRESVRPGITGLWQISGRSKIGFKEMVWMDLYYAENQSLLFDFEIIFATIPVVLFGKGAY